ncbi:type II secretion system protein [Pseudoduganella namucuonensis]|uniref:MSHA pilin protein MshD n=1 Tax=Pseudoduganella namucuonensis TaxID=1035707 RepID=A0A1I7L6D7_9BURK|nr:type II secretion system protein [Pseudoduganella namucuonensis]SFV05076.1 MSHA pilin protein MshD [Pseudoduganella namucuonensis]
MWNKRRQQGVTLVELIIAMVIIGISVAGVVQVFNLNTVASADPMITKQMRAVAESLMEEIQHQQFDAQANTGAAAGCARDTFNDVRDYHGYTQANVCDIGGVSLGLSGMGVSVTVTNAATSLFPGVPAGSALQIQITVTQGTQSFKLLGWRTDFG